MSAELELSTSRRIEARDVTDLVAGQSYPDGLLWVSCPHTTGALLLCESDPEMLADLEQVAAEIFAPFEPFRHRKNDNPNGAAHLFSSLMGTQLLVPVVDGAVRLGTYQRIIFLELDGPRKRRIQTASLAEVRG
ncbi:MAG TPA: secondary thiamine-phosphate synthase enzyme YjbQ [Candidatus Limnocylindria bacterium]|nr:secondary thiamine-phosphate synthase enzyme YjbQ [Candidatus Limnocylindria bacterium]